MATFLIVSVRMIKGKMESPAFLATGGRVDNQRRDFDQISQFKKFSRDFEVPVKLLHFTLEIVQAGGGTLQSLGGTNNGHVVPH